MVILDDTKERIIHAAMRVVRQYGLEGVRIQDISDLAGISSTMFSGLEMGERPCKLLNISVGGAYIESECRYHTGDKFLLKFKLLEDRPISTMYCQVVRITEKESGKLEYGCQFLELTEEDQETITKNIFAIQRQKRGRS